MGVRLWLGDSAGPQEHLPVRGKPSQLHWMGTGWLLMVFTIATVVLVQMRRLDCLVSIW